MSLSSVFSPFPSQSLAHSSIINPDHAHTNTHTHTQYASKEACNYLSELNDLTSSEFATAYNAILNLAFGADGTEEINAEVLLE